MARGKLFSNDVGLVDVPTDKRVLRVDVEEFDGAERVVVFLEDRPLTQKVLATVDIAR